MVDAPGFHCIISSTVRLFYSSIVYHVGARFEALVMGVLLAASDFSRNVLYLESQGTSDNHRLHVVSRQTKNPGISGGQ